MKWNINQELFVSCSYMSLISKFNMLLNMLKKCLNSVPNNINTFQEEKSIEEVWKLWQISFNNNLL